MSDDINNNGIVPYSEMDDFGSDDDPLTGTDKSTDSDLGSSGETMSQNQEDAPGEFSEEYAMVEQPVNMEMSSNCSSNDMPNYLPPPPLTNSYSSASPQASILVMPPSPVFNYPRMNLFNSEMGRNSYRPVQNPGMFNQPSLPSPSPQLYQPYASPMHVYSTPTQNHGLVQPQSPSYYYQGASPVYPMQQQSYQYQPLQQVQTPVLQTPPLYQSSQTNMRQSNNLTSCPYGHNVMYPYPALCPYCYPAPQSNTPQQGVQEDYDVYNTNRNRNRQRRGKNRGRRPVYPEQGQCGPYRQDSGNENNLTNDNKENEPILDQSQVQHKKPDNFKLFVAHFPDCPLRDNLNNDKENPSSDIEQVKPEEKVDLAKETDQAKQVEGEQHLFSNKTTITNNASISDGNTMTSVTSTQTTSEIITTTSSEIISVKGSHVSCQTTPRDKDFKKVPLMVESWTQTESPFSVIKFGSVRDIMAETTQKTEISITTDKSKMKVCSSTKISTPRPSSTSYAAIVAKKPNPKDEIKTKSTSTPSSAGQSRSEAPMKVETSKLIKRNKLESISKQNGKLSTTTMKKENVAKKNTSIKTDTPAKKDTLPKKDVPPNKDSLPKREVPDKKETLLKKVVNSRENKGCDHTKLRVPIVLELALTQKMFYPALKVVFQRYIYKGMKLDEISHKIYLLTFFNSEDAFEVLNNKYSFGSVTTLSEAAPKSKREARFIINSYK